MKQWKVTAVITTVVVLIMGGWLFLSFSVAGLLFSNHGGSPKSVSPPQPSQGASTDAQPPPQPTFTQAERDAAFAQYSMYDYVQCQLDSIALEAVCAEGDTSAASEQKNCEGNEYMLFTLLPTAENSLISSGASSIAEHDAMVDALTKRAKQEMEVETTLQYIQAHGQELTQCVRAGNSLVKYAPKSLGAVKGVWVAEPSTQAPTEPTSQPQTANYPPVSMGERPLFRLVRGNDQFYTTDCSERNDAVTKYGYSYKGVEAYVFSSSGSHIVPLYRLYNSLIHLYTADQSEEEQDLRSGWQLEGTMGYVANAPQPDLVPLYRSRTSNGGYLYTTDLNERNSAIANGGTDEGITGWVVQKHDDPCR